MQWALIGADNSWLAGPLDAEPELEEGQRAVIIAAGYPDACIWSKAAGGFVDLLPAAPRMTVGRFMLLLTQAERIAIRAAAAGNAQIYDFLDVLRGFTDGVSLADPDLVLGINHIATAGLITADRATAILAGQAPPAA